MLPDWVIQKFWCYANPTWLADDCWIWSGTLSRTGYALCLGPRRDRNIKLASHVSLILHGHPRPEAPGNFALHGDCSNPGCVNPAHLRWGSAGENADDKVRLGRHNSPKGERHYRAKLTVEEVRAIRSDTRSHRQIARDYGISAPTVTHIRTRRYWQHVE